MSRPPFFQDVFPLDHPPTVGWIDDDELGELHGLLWHGYAPAQFVRHEWDFGASGCSPNPPAALFRSARQAEEERRQAIEARRAWDRRHADDLERWRQEASDREYVKLNRYLFVWGSLCFVCDRCRRRFTSGIGEDQAELDYLREFAGRIQPVGQRMVLCEGCFGAMSAAGGGNGRNAA